MKKRLLFAVALVLAALASSAPVAQAGGECDLPTNCLNPEEFCECRAAGGSYFNCLKSCTHP